MTIDLHAGDLIKVRGYQQSPNGGLIPVYSICEVVAVECDKATALVARFSTRRFANAFESDQRVRVVHHYPNNPAGWELPSFTVSIDDILPPF